MVLPFEKREMLTEHLFITKRHSFIFNTIKTVSRAVYCKRKSNMSTRFAVILKIEVIQRKGLHNPGTSLLEMRKMTGRQWLPLPAASRKDWSLQRDKILVHAHH